MKEPEELAQHLKNRLKRKKEESLSKKFNSHTNQPTGRQVLIPGDPRLYYHLQVTPSF